MEKNEIVYHMDLDVKNKENEASLVQKIMLVIECIICFFLQVHINIHKNYVYPCYIKTIHIQVYHISKIIYISKYVTSKLYYASMFQLYLILT